MKFSHAVLTFCVSGILVGAGEPDFSTLKAAAEKGDPQAQLSYSKAIYAKSSEESKLWAQRAADQGLGEAWFWLGQTTVGKWSEANYEKGAEAGHPESFTHLLDLLLFRATTEADIARAKKFADAARSRSISLEPLSGEDSAKRFATVDICFEAGKPEIPAGDRPTVQQIAELKKLNGECLLAHPEVTKRNDWSSYRQCLLSDEPVDNAFLAEIYANGWGVKRNPKLAIALVCHGSDVPMELVGMAQELQASRNEASLAKPFLRCDHAGSGMNGGRCARRQDFIKASQEDAGLGKVIESWTDSQKQAFQKLKKAANAFFKEHSVSEQDMSGSARGQIATEAEATLRATFLKSLAKFEAAKFPSDQNFERADAELNQIYSAIQKKEKLSRFGGTATRDGVKVTQRKWLSYRDAWVSFAASKYPKIAPVIFKTWVTRERTALLKALSR